MDADDENLEILGLGQPRPRLRDLETEVIFNALACIAFFDWEKQEAQPGPYGFRYRFRRIGKKAVELETDDEPIPGEVSKLLNDDELDIPANLTARQVESLKKFAAEAAAVVTHKGVHAMHDWFADKARDESIAAIDWQPFSKADVWCAVVGEWTCASQAVVDALVVLATKSRKLTTTRGVALGTIRALAHRHAPLLYERDMLITVVDVASGLTGSDEGAFYDVFTWLLNEAKKTDGQRVALKLKPKQTLAGAVAEALGKNTPKQRLHVKAALEYGAVTRFRGVVVRREASSLWVLNQDSLAGVGWIQLGDMLSPRYAATVSKMLDTAEGKAALREARIPEREVRHDLLLIPTPETATLPLDGVGTSEHVLAKRLFLNMLAEMAGHAYLMGAKVDLEALGAKHGLSAKTVESILRAWTSAGVVVTTESGGMQLGERYGQEHEAMLTTARLSDRQRRRALKGAESKRLAASNDKRPRRPTKATAKRRG